MPLMALCLPILPGKEAKWQQMVDRISNGDMKAKMDASRRAAGVHERTFVQRAPQGSMVIVTLDGDDPGEAFARMMADPSMQEFAEWAADVHGMDPSAPPPALPELVYDSRA